MDQQSSVSHVQPAGSAGDPPAPAKRRHWWIWVLVLLAFGLTFYWVMTRQQHSEAASAGGRPGAGGPGGGGGGGRRMMGGAVPVILATAHTGNLGIYHDAIGTVTPLHTVSINAQVTGPITEVHFREGQMVKKGDPLVDLDCRPYQAQLSQAEGTLDRDKGLLAQAEMNLQRFQQAWTKNAISRQTLEDQAKLVDETKGTVKNDEGAVAYSKIQVGYCHITSPISGRVGLRLVDPGNLVTANSTTTLVVVTEIHPITVVFTLAEDALPGVLQQTRKGRALQVEALDRTQQGHLATGKLTSIDNQIDTTTGTVKLRAEFDNREDVLFPNQFVNTRLLVNTLQNQTLVPSSAIQHNGAQDFVYVIQDNKAQMRNVKVGNSDKGETAVVEGLKPGEVVANSSFERLQNGAQVTESKSRLPSTSRDTTTGSPAQ